MDSEHPKEHVLAARRPCVCRRFSFFMTSHLILLVLHSIFPKANDNPAVIAGARERVRPPYRPRDVLLHRRRGELADVATRLQMGTG